MDRVHASMDWPGVLGPSWTDGGTDRGGAGCGGALTRAQPPAAPVHQSSPAGAQQREERMGSSARASPGSGGVVATGRRRWHEEVTGNSAGRVSDAGEEKRREGRSEVWVALRVVRVAFIGLGEGTEGGWPE
jgi:hypothetical protein